LQTLAKGLYLLRTGGSLNAYLIEGSRGLTLVDAGHCRGTDALLAEIKSAGFSYSDLELLVLTHGHFDTAGGAAGLLKRKRVKVYAHPGEHKALTAPPEASGGLLGMGAFIVRRIVYPFEALPVVLPIHQGETLRSIPEWQVIHTPGHTAGSICLFKPTEKILICGDAVSKKGRELSLFPGPENIDQATSSVRRLAGLGCEMVAPCRGPVIRIKAAQLLKNLAQELEGETPALI
jgi:glyoxylase-like metal-dependent hydrolase (beta-lactamase superfamily II)